MTTEAADKIEDAKVVEPAPKPQPKSGLFDGDINSSEIKLKVGKARFF